ARPYDSEFIDTVRYGLAIFDEHNTQDDARAFRSILDTTPSRELPPFRVLDAATKAASLEPAGTGLLLFNLEARRIVQVQNSYAQLLRQDRGRIRRNGQPTRILYHYRLPDDWSIVP
ncbi:MAG: hypothetical protein IRY97_06520, partial [Thermomicrobiaceae bacterium]|nr:hypothetical protein [Thermomicrobiaceae bacterium]